MKLKFLLAVGFVKKTFVRSCVVGFCVRLQAYNYLRKEVRVFKGKPILARIKTSMVPVDCYKPVQQDQRSKQPPHCDPSGAFQGPVFPGEPYGLNAGALSFCDSLKVIYGFPTVTSLPVVPLLFTCCFCQQLESLKGDFTSAAASSSKPHNLHTHRYSCERSEFTSGHH